MKYTLKDEKLFITNEGFRGDNKESEIIKKMGKIDSTCIDAFKEDLYVVKVDETEKNYLEIEKQMKTLQGRYFKKKEKLNRVLRDSMISKQLAKQDLDLRLPKFDVSDFLKEKHESGKRRLVFGDYQSFEDINTVQKYMEKKKTQKEMLKRKKVARKLKQGKNIFSGEKQSIKKVNRRKGISLHIPSRPHKFKSTLNVGRSKVNPFFKIKGKQKQKNKLKSLQVTSSSHNKDTLNTSINVTKNSYKRKQTHSSNFNPTLEKNPLYQVKLSQYHAENIKGYTTDVKHALVSETRDHLSDISAFTFKEVKNRIKELEANLSQIHNQYLTYLTLKFGTMNIRKMKQDIVSESKDQYFKKFHKTLGIKLQRIFGRTNKMLEFENKLKRGKLWRKYLRARWGKEYNWEEIEGKNKPEEFADNAEKEIHLLAKRLKELKKFDHRLSHFENLRVERLIEKYKFLKEGLGSRIDEIENFKKIQEMEKSNDDDDEEEGDSIFRDTHKSFDLEDHFRKTHQAYSKIKFYGNPYNSVYLNPKKFFDKNTYFKKCKSTPKMLMEKMKKRKDINKINLLGLRKSGVPLKSPMASIDIAEKKFISRMRHRKKKDNKRILRRFRSLSNSIHDLKKDFEGLNVQMRKARYGEV